MTWFFAVFVPVAAFFWAKLEIEIEGEHGWAANLPTWRVEQHYLLDLFYGGRPLTGYHVWAFLSVFLFLHAPLFWTATWSWPAERAIVGAYILFWILEDALWFLFNPKFGWRSFRRGKVWWHKRWFLGLPLDYWYLSAIAVILVVSARPR